MPENNAQTLIFRESGYLSWPSDQYGWQELLAIERLVYLVVISHECLGME